MSGARGGNGGGGDKRSPGGGGAGVSGRGGTGSGGKREVVYSDRFVPSRSASAGLQGFNLLDSGHPPASTSHPSSEREVRVLLYTPCLLPLPLVPFFHFRRVASGSSSAKRMLKSPPRPHPPHPFAFNAMPPSFLFALDTAPNP